MHEVTFPFPGTLGSPRHIHSVPSSIQEEGMQCFKMHLVDRVSGRKKKKGIKLKSRVSADKIGPQSQKL